jgi:hypothetical protein
VRGCDFGQSSLKTTSNSEQVVIPHDRIKKNSTGLGRSGHPKYRCKQHLEEAVIPQDRIKQNSTLSEEERVSLKTGASSTRRKRSSLKTGSRKKTSLDSEEEGIPQDRIK